MPCSSWKLLDNGGKHARDYAVATIWKGFSTPSGFARRLRHGLEYWFPAEDLANLDATGSFEMCPTWGMSPAWR